MLTLIMCNLVILSGIFRQAEGELELLQRVLERTVVWQTLPKAGLSQVLNSFSHCLRISNWQKRLIQFFFASDQKAWQLHEIHNRLHSLPVYKWFFFLRSFDVRDFFYAMSYTFICLLL